jgi:hypothetical protein
MIPKSGYRFSEKIMLKQQAKAKYPINRKSFRFSCYVNSLGPIAIAAIANKVLAVNACPRLCPFLSPLRGERSDCQRVRPEVAGPMTSSAIRVRGTAAILSVAVTPPHPDFLPASGEKELFLSIRVMFGPTNALR